YPMWFMTRLALLMPMLAFTLALVVGSFESLRGATLIFTNIPAYGSAEPLSGLVQGADPSRTAVAVLIYVPGYGWVSKPTCAQQLTTIRPDGSWSAPVVTGGSDQL